MPRTVRRTAFRTLVAALLTAAAGAAQPAATDAAATETAAGEATSASLITREGVKVELSVRPLSGDAERPIAADWADVTFRITDASTGEPIKGRYPAAWMDLGMAWEAKGDRPMSCRDRVRTYLQGIVGVRPMLDLNSHFLLVLNRGPSISVIDPVVGITGITNLFAQINLESPGGDWALTEDDKRMFVTMPAVDRVAVVDTTNFEVITSVPAGDEPMRARMQRDGRYLWVGNNAGQEGLSGVSVIDTASLEVTAFIPTGPGHHEIVFTDDDRYAFVSNRDGGTVSVVDVQKLEVVKHVATGPKPISLGFSALGKALYVADGQDGRIAVVDPDRLEIRSRIDAAPGLGPMAFSQDGRWGVAVNPIDDKVYIFDASTDALAHVLAVGKQPYQVMFTRSFAYVRSLGTQDVGLIPVSELAEGKKPAVTYIPAGQRPPGLAKDISIAQAMVPSVKEAAAAYIVNQTDGTVSYYMEGMAAPMGSFRNYGHQARAIEIVDRSLSEREPGVYVGRVKIPVPGSYDIAFLMDTPQFLHCFTAEVDPNPDVATVTAPMGIEFQLTEWRVPVGVSTTVRFRLTDPVTSLPESDLEDVTLLYYRSDGRGRKIVAARPVGDGTYEADVILGSTSTYYLFVGSRSKALKYTDLPYASLMGVPAKAVKAAEAAKAEK